LLVNPQAESFLKIKTNEVKGKLISELTKYANLKPLIDLLGKEVKDIFRKELAIKEDLILEISIVSMVSGKEKLGKLIILHDITREKIVEKMKTEFVSLSAHQLRTPLSAIKWILKMFLDGDVGEITFEQKNLLKKAYQSNERMIFLINDLLNVARIEEGKYLYKSKLVSIEDIIESIIKSLQQEIKRKRLIFEFKKPKEKLAPIMIDAEKMQLAIQNLIENAVRYTKMGGRVTIVLKGDGKEIEFSVQDTGIGIPQEYQKRIFTKFFRGTNAVKMETEGSGLGLFISKNIIEAHKGRVWFESKKSKGSTFYFTLPIKNDKI
jgi:signal transduction histidine kinase